ncbi:MAG: methyltransferase domain-containing protein [Bacteroidetes bacterium]|nr:MAG: methyltransferase domain-containing protein [Bacteroidota bacterium]
MPVAYDSYYQTEDYVGAPYPELVAFYAQQADRGKLLDLGCGQGRDAAALARLGYVVTGVDYSEVGINQLHAVAQREDLPLRGVVADVYTFEPFAGYQHILLDSMFHFAKKERAQEQRLFRRIVEGSDPGTLLTICLQDVGEKVAVLDGLIAEYAGIEEVKRARFRYTFEDKASGHRVETPYLMIALRI